jgi:hypothetical protein
MGIFLKGESIMKFSILKLVRVAVILAATPAALATTWYVNGCERER